MLGHPIQFTHHELDIGQKANDKPTMLTSFSQKKKKTKNVRKSTVLEMSTV